MRMGLHIGEAQQRGGDYYGTAVNRAARLMSAANGGQVLLSAAVAGMVTDQLPDGVSLRDLGEHRLKDLQRPEQVFQFGSSRGFQPTFRPSHHSTGCLTTCLHSPQLLSDGRQNWARSTTFWSPIRCDC